MMQARLFDPANPPEWTTPEWYALRDAAPHLEQEGHRQRLLLAADMVREALGDGCESVIDLGAGDGGLLSLVTDHPNATYTLGFDLQPSNVSAAVQRGANVQLRDIVHSLPWLEDTDVVVALEVLEHLVDPHDLVRRIAETPARWLVASSPYTETPESHYGYHTWAFDLEGYRALMEDNGWRVVRQETAWISQVVMCQRVMS